MIYKVSIIGAGNIAAGFDSPESKKILTHAHAVIDHSDFKLLGFFDRDETRAFEAVRRWGGKAYADMETAVRNADIVCCCVPDRFHGGVLKEVARYRPRLVIAEKPLADKYEEAIEIQELYGGEIQIPLVVNYSRRFLKEFHQLKCDIKLYGKFLKGVGYYGKGILHNGSHMIDVLQFLLGKVQDIKTLRTKIYDFEPNDPSHDVVLKVQQENFYMMAIDCRVVTIFEMELFFEKARVRILNGGERIEIYHVKESDTYAGYKNYQMNETRKVNYSEAMKGLMENVSRFLKGEEALNCTLQDGIDVLKICMRIRGDLI